MPPDRLNEEERILDSLRRGERVDHFETVRVSKRRPQNSRLTYDFADQGLRGKCGRRLENCPRRRLRRRADRGVARHCQGRIGTPCPGPGERQWRNARNSPPAIPWLNWKASPTVSRTTCAPVADDPEFLPDWLLVAEAGEKLGPNERELCAQKRQRGEPVGSIDSRRADLQSCIACEAIEVISWMLNSCCGKSLTNARSFQPPKAEIKIQLPLDTARGHEAYSHNALPISWITQWGFVSPGRKPQVRIWSESTDHQVRFGL